MQTNTFNNPHLSILKTVQRIMALNSNLASPHDEVLKRYRVTKRNRFKRYRVAKSFGTDKWTALRRERDRDFREAD